MPELDDQQLLWEFAETHSEAAFAALVARHVNLVYSTALRFSGNPHRAEEITQAVFIILACKAGSLGKNVILSGWLYQTARLTAANVVKSEIRRQRREQEACMQCTLNEPVPAAAWEEIAPLLDDAMGRLGETDRNAVVLRFFENKTAREVAAALKLTEAAAHKRVNRALDKLRKFFIRRGVNSTVAAIGETISLNSVQAAPAALAKSITAVALAKGAAASTSTLTLIKGALKIMAWTKAKTAILVGAGLLLAAGTTTVTVKEVQRRQISEWDTGRTDIRILRTGPHIVRIIPSRFSNPDGPGGWASIGNGRVIGVGDSPLLVVLAAYDGDPRRTILLTTLPQKKYDFIANLLSGSQAALRREVARELGLVARRETVTTNVLFLKTTNSYAPGLRPASTTAGVNSTSEKPGHIHLVNMSVGNIAGYLENLFAVPIFDQTGLKGRYHINLKWDVRNDPQHENLKRALREQLGLELVPGTAPVEMLVVERAK